jgi:kynurenine 3-monooxygenase
MRSIPRGSDAASRRLLVVGGGLVGSLLAMFLARRGYGVDVYDRQSDPRRGQGGRLRPSINLTLCTRGLAALASLGLDRRILDLAVPLRGRRIHAHDGTIADQPYGNRGESIHSISRAELGDALVGIAREEPGITYHFGEKCVQLDPVRGVARFENIATGTQSEACAEAIFGADGAYSAVRLQLQKRELFNYSQAYSSQGYKELAIPPGPRGEWALDPHALHVWPRGGFMLIGFPNRDRSFTLALHAPYRGEHSFERIQTDADVVAFMREWFPDVVDAIPDIARQFFARPANSMLTIRCEPWSSSGRVLLVGDAAHAVLPFYGQGANAGFEGCRVLDRCIEAHGDDWPTVFREYERLRRPNMDVMADLCVEHFAELRDRLGDPRFLLRKKLERRLEELDPARFVPLYSMVTFTCTPYAEALRIDHAQRALVDRLLQIEGIESRIHEPTIASIVEQCRREVA